MQGECYPRNLDEFDRQFGTDEACRRYLFHQRWPNGFRCPRCGHDKGWPIATRALVQCASCDHQTSLTAGTVLEGTRKPLRLWFKAMWLVATKKTGISAKDLQRALGFGSYETAWTWLHKLRRAMVRPERLPLKGFVEVDVTEVTCEDPARYPDPKTLVQVAVEVGSECMGRLRMNVVASQSSADLMPPLQQEVETGSTLHTDGWSGYKAAERGGFQHAVDVVGKNRAMSSVLFPNVNRVASLVKRFLLGTYQGAARWFQLQHYLDEFVFRFNRRRSKWVGKIFMRMAQQAATMAHTPYRTIAYRQRLLAAQAIGAA